MKFIILSALLLLTVQAHADKDEHKANKIEELRNYHKQMLEERLKNLETRHQKKIEFENEMYDEEKSHIQSVAKLEDGIQADNLSANQKIVAEIKAKMKAFSAKMKAKSEEFHRSLNKDIEARRSKTKKK